MKLTEERVIPKLMNPRNGMLIEHIARYYFAAQFARGRVLDIACGVGYGAEILLNQSSHVQSVLGVDNNVDSINYAKSNYTHEKADFVLNNALSLSLAEELGQFDTVISFETVEHLKEDALFIQNLKRLLKSDGTLIISTPYGRGRGIPCANPFHVHQYKEQEFIELLNPFKNIELYCQVDKTIEKRQEGKKYYLMVAVCKH